jgi:NADPH:quinone reductase
MNRGFNLRLHPFDFSLQRLYSSLQLLHRKWIEILLHKLRQRIARLAGKEFFQVHGVKVDPAQGGVNKRFPKVVENCRSMRRTVPDTMIVVEADGLGGPEVLKPAERPVPETGAGEVLIKVEAAGVNRPDVMQRLGLYPPPPGAPSTLGLEVAGSIVEAGDGSLIGRRVCALVAGGGYAEYCAAPAGLCLPVPDALSSAEAAAIPETLFTVWSNLFQRGGAGEGDVVLVHGGTSGIGSMAIALGRIFGLEVIVTVGSDEKCSKALEIGAHHAINYRSRDFAEEVLEITGGKGVDTVLDMVGGDYVARNLACLADEGRHISIAIQRGPKAEISLWDVMRKRLTLTGSTLRPRSLAFKAALAQDIRSKVWPHIEAGRLRPVIDSSFPLDRAADAHRRMEGGEHVGKIVLIP